LKRKLKKEDKDEIDEKEDEEDDEETPLLLTYHSPTHRSLTPLIHNRAHFCWF
jgi:hypothetical protein